MRASMRASGGNLMTLRCCESTESTLNAESQFETMSRWKDGKRFPGVKTLSPDDTVLAAGWFWREAAGGGA